MPEHHREQDGYIPAQIKWIMTFINRVGFPIAVCIWLAYQNWSQGKDSIKQGAETVATMNGFKEVMIGLKASIDQQNRILRHKHGDD